MIDFRYEWFLAGCRTQREASTRRLRIVRVKIGIGMLAAMFDDVANGFIFAFRIIMLSVRGVFLRGLPPMRVTEIFVVFLYVAII